MFTMFTIDPPPDDPYDRYDEGDHLADDGDIGEDMPNGNANVIVPSGPAFVWDPQVNDVGPAEELDEADIPF